MAGDRNDQGSALKHLRNAVEVGSPERDGAYLADAYRRLGDAYGRTRLTPLVARLFRGWLGWLA